MKNHLNLLDTGNGNTKIKKTAQGSKYRVASLSLMPDRVLCPGSKAAGCFDACLKSAGRGRFDNVAHGREWRSELFHTDQEQFLKRLTGELSRFIKTCHRSGLLPAARLNVLSDIPWENYLIPQLFPSIKFYDYTKRAARLAAVENIENYSLMFSYSGRPEYAAQVERALAYDVPVAVVFRGPFPEQFLGRPVIDGDKSDLVNAAAGRVVVGLKAKGKAAQDDRSGFVVHTLPGNFQPVGDIARGLVDNLARPGLVAAE